MYQYLSYLKKNCMYSYANTLRHLSYNYKSLKIKK